MKIVILILNIITSAVFIYSQNNNTDYFQKKYNKLRYLILKAQREGDYIKSFELYDKAFNFVSKSKKEFEKYDLMMMLSQNYILIGDTVKAKELLFKTYNYFNTSGNLKKHPFIFGRLGNYYLVKGNYGKAIEFIKTGIFYSERDYYRGQLYGNLGLVYEKMKEADSALYYFNKSLFILKKENTTFQLAELSGYLAQHYYNKKDYYNAITQYKEAIKYYDLVEYNELKIYTISKLTHVLIIMGRLNEAAKYIEIIKEYAFRTKSSSLKYVAHLEMETYFKANNIEMAKLSLKKYIQIADSIEKTYKLRDIRILSGRIERERDLLNAKNTEIAIHKSSRIYYLWIFSLLILIIGLLGIGYLIKRKSNKKLNILNTDLEFANKQLSAFFNQTDHTIKIINEDRTVLFWNKKSYEISKLSEEAVLNRDYIDIIKEYAIKNDNLELYINHFKEFFNSNTMEKTNPSMNLEYEVYLNNDVHIYQETIFGISLKNRFYIGIIGKDVTLHMKQKNMLIEAKVKAEKADRLKTDFLAQMSHEIRTPLNIILSYSNFLQEHLEEVNDEIIVDSFTSINRGAQRIIRTIDLILNVSEIQAGLYNFQPKIIDLYEQVIKPFVKDIEKIALKKGIKLQMEKIIDDCCVYCDEYAVNHIIQNLLDNAVKFTNEGFIKIRILSLNKDLILLEIIDSGIGMSDEFLKNIFKSFVQEEQGYTRKYEGNGLGLALVKLYCDLNKIKIECISSKNNGTIFKLLFHKNLKSFQI